MSESCRLPVVLVEAAPLTPLASDAEPLSAAETITAEEVISKRGIVDIETGIAVVCINDSDRYKAIVSGLLLRNAGWTAIVCDKRNVPLGLMLDIQKFTLQAKSEGRPIRTEVLLTDEAMQAFGDISDIVRRFEEDYLRP